MKKVSKKSNKNYDQEDEILKYLQQIKEKSLIDNVLMPLFRKIGYDKVEFFGGPNEGGKDIVCWRRDQLGDIELGVAQVKRYKPSQRAADSRSFAEVVRQLSQACEKKLPYTDGQYYSPRTVYFVSPFPLDTRTLLTRIEGYDKLLKPYNVKIIDGNKLLSLLRDYLPNLLTDIGGIRYKIHNSAAKLLSNEDLMLALDKSHGHHVKVFYTDIDLSIGRPTTRLFLHSKFHSKKLTKSASAALLSHILKLVENAQMKLNINLLTESTEIIKNRFEKYLLLYKREEKKYFVAQQSLSSAEKVIKELQKKVRMLKKDINKIIPLISNKRIKKSFMNFPELNINEIRGDYSIIEAKLKEYEDSYKYLSLIKSDINNASFQKYQKTRQTIKSIVKDFKPLQALVRKEKLISQRFNKMEKPKYVFTLNGQVLATMINNKRIWIKKKIRDFNKKKPSSRVLCEFLQSIKALFETTATLLENELFLESIIGAGFKKARHIKPEEYRLKLSIHDLFDTGVNFSVFGDAGAGKTTSLQMYTHKLLNDGSHAIFAPLSRVISAIEDQIDLTRDNTIKPKIEDSIVSYLRSMNIEITKPELMTFFSQEKVVLMLDSIDEVIQRAPWILQSIKTLENTYPRLQIITSSRMSGEYIEDIPFLGITLLPFTTLQRNNFINKWFGSKNEKKANYILNHLEKNKAISDIINNPLLATILCVLADKEVPLPNNELKLYENRLKLLLGDFDIHKNVRRIKSDRDHLVRVAEYIAFYFHSNGMRQAKENALVKIGHKVIGIDLDEKALKIAIHELIDPCNILVPMTEDGKFGFGHLRFQEHLVARKLTYDRSIPLIDCMKNLNWIGVFRLFSLMCPRLDWLVDKIAFEENIDRFEEILIEMISVRSNIEKKEIKDQINSYRCVKISTLSMEEEKILREVIEDCKSDI